VLSKVLLGSELQLWHTSGQALSASVYASVNEAVIMYTSKVLWRMNRLSL
jgi:hypothetical protein